MEPLPALTSADTADRPLLVLPLGSTEQHGPHLPLGTDTIVAEAVATALALRLGAVLGPALTVGASGEHQGFPGTLSIGTEALRIVLIELARSARLWAAGLVLVNAHGGNTETARAAVVQLREEGHVVVLVVCAPDDGDAHAGRTETSLMLHLRPDLVGADRPVGEMRPLAEVLPELRRGGVVAVSANGVLGDARGASAEEGARLLAAMVDVAETVVRRRVPA